MQNRRTLTDLLFAGLIAVLVVIDVASAGVGGGREADLAAYVLVVSGAAALAWRRRRPVIVLGVVATVLVVFWARGHVSLLPVLGLPSLYAVAVHGENRRRAWIAIAVVSAALMAAASVTVLDTADGFSYFSAASMAAYLAGGTMVGVLIRNRERIFVDTERRAVEAEADRLAEAQRAVALERIRIAREMHDVVAHGMSVIAVQAAAAQEIAHTDPDKTVEVLASIETVGRESLSEMRRMLGVLRSDDEPGTSFAPQPTLSDVAEVVAQSVGSGVATKLVITGNMRDLPPGVELAAFRIVQEALTNVRRHGGQWASAVVQVGYDSDAVTISITDDGVGVAPSLTESSGGNGLIGMRERVETYGGELSAGPRPGGGFLVQATLPVADTRPAMASAAPLVEPTS